MIWIRTLGYYSFALVMETRANDEQSLFKLDSRQIFILRSAFPMPAILPHFLSLSFALSLSYSLSLSLSRSMSTVCTYILYNCVTTCVTMARDYVPKIYVRMVYASVDLLLVPSFPFDLIFFCSTKFFSLRSCQANSRHFTPWDICSGADMRAQQLDCMVEIRRVRRKRVREEKI